MPEGGRVGRRAAVVDTAAAVPARGAEAELVCPGKRVEGLAGSLEVSACGSARGTGSFLTCPICPPASHITKDMLPGPYPKTPEERAAAAKKYNMRVEDYEPYPDDGMG